MTRGLHYAAILDTSLTISCSSSEIMDDSVESGLCAVRLTLSIHNRLAEDLWLFGGTILASSPGDDTYFVHDYVDVNASIPNQSALELPPLIIRYDSFDASCADSNFREKIAQLPSEKVILKFRPDKMRLQNGERFWSFPYDENWRMVKMQAANL